MSQFGGLKLGANVGHEQVESYVEQRASRGEIRHGRIRLQPHWNADYRQLVAARVQHTGTPPLQRLYETFETQPAAVADDRAVASTRRVSATSGVDSTVEPAPVQLAYLIIAHHQPNHLARLIQALDDENSSFFIHIDDKVALVPFQAAVPAHENIAFLPNRVAVEWGKLSVVQAMLNLIRAAVASDQAFRYFTMLSGSDYPIKHKQEIYTRLQASDCQFLRVDRKLTNEATNTHRHLIEQLPQETYFGNLTPYHGSLYWSLTADCIRFILNFVDNNPGYVEIHRNLFAPDEVFFHSIVKHSPFAGAISHDFSDDIYPNHTHHGNHFIDWAGLRQRKGLILDERDFDDLLASAALFARKFDEEKSRLLLDMLDERVHQAYMCVESAQEHTI